MDDIKVIKKVVAPAACWFTIKPPESEEDALAVIKVELDRAYPYIWVASQNSSSYFGLALTFDDVKRVAAFDPETNVLTGFDLYGDGVLSADGYAARCISAGTRKTFYVIPGSKSARVREEGLIVSAQDNPVCPFARTTGSW